MMEKKWYHKIGIFDSEDFFTFLAVVEINHKDDEGIVDAGWEQFAGDYNGTLPKFSIKMMFLIARFKKYLVKLKEPNEYGETYSFNFPSQCEFVSV